MFSPLQELQRFLASDLSTAVHVTPIVSVPDNASDNVGETTTLVNDGRARENEIPQKIEFELLENLKDQLKLCDYNQSYVGEDNDDNIGDESDEDLLAFEDFDDDDSGPHTENDAAAVIAPAHARLLSAPVRARSVHRHAGLIKTLATVHELAVTECQTTKRDLFYRDKQTYLGSQTNSDRSLEQVAVWLQRPRSQLRVLAARKGLVVGPVAFDDAAPASPPDLLAGATGAGVVSIPADWTDMTLNPSAAVQFLLVVEKECVFDQLVQHQFAAAHRCVVCTGKGYPDLSTRQFVRQFAARFRLPVFGLVDWDPHGLEILLTYALGGSKRDPEQFGCPTIKWLGLLAADFAAFQLPVHTQLPLTVRDRAKGTQLLQNNGALGARPLWRQQLLSMLELGKKAELEAVHAGPGGFTSFYLPQKIQQGSWL